MAAQSLQCMEDASNSSGPIIEDITELCDFCVELTELIVKVPLVWTYKFEMKHSTIDSDPKTCRLCAMISSLIGITPHTLKHVLRENQFIFPLRPENPWHYKLCGMATLGLTFALWADKNSTACTTLVDRPPILGPQMDEIRDLIQHWRDICTTHRTCVAEGNTLMPTRVLRLCGDYPRPSIQLVRTKGQKGRYIALSHCWGSTEKRPLQTTSQNLIAHQVGILFEDLPKTFQDVVELAQAIGIRYVWIDSLCIIQGNRRDWHAEAKKMGDVYRNAALVVAASGAKDSSEGLFITNRASATIYRIPYRVAGEIKGTFNMTALPSKNWHPKDGPLETRAWTLQERYLARRFITFMPRSVIWACKTARSNEVGDHVFDLDPTMLWFDLLQMYTKRSLTFLSDRPEALRGIAEEFQRARKDRYVPEYGVWEDKLVFQLLWFNHGPRLDDETAPNLPSWSWAATSGTKRWPDRFYRTTYVNVYYAEEMPKRLVITSTGHLQILGPLSTFRPILGYVRDTSAARDLQLNEFDHIDDDDGVYDMGTERQGFYTVIQQTSEFFHQQVLGIARSDSPKPTLYTHACFLAKQKRKYNAKTFSQYWKIRGTRFINERRSVKPDAVMKAQAIGDYTYHTEQDPDFMYWVLLLERVGEAKFRRVGMAILMPVAYKAFNVKVQKFEIV